MQTSALIFDLDGLLIDSEPIWQRVEVNVFGHYGLTLTIADTQKTTGLRIDQVISYWQRHRPGEFSAPSREIQDAVLDQMVTEIANAGEPMPGAHHALTLAAQTGLPVAIASSSPMRLIDAAVERLNARTLFTALMSAEHLPAGKPDPQIYLDTASSLNVHPECCIAFEDSPNGVRAARSAGMYCYGVPEVHHAELVNSLASCTLKSLADLGLNDVVTIPTGHTPQ